MTDLDAETILERAGFDPTESVLTRRQAEVLALRERGLAQATIADRLGTSRANVSSVESSARDNVAAARETVAVADALRAPVGLTIEAGTDLYDVPSMVFAACDEVAVKVGHTAPELMQLISDEAGEAVAGRNVDQRLYVSVTNAGEVRVRRQRDG
jgi:Tfx family DNA-binding protein